MHDLDTIKKLNDEITELRQRGGAKAHDSRVEQETLEGRKNDQAKLRYDLLPPELDAAVAAVLSYGAVKYEDRNWERGMAWSRPLAALRRHMAAWESGETADPETGLPHLWHAATNIAFLIAFEARKTGRDDRVTAYPLDMHRFEWLLSEALDRHAEASI